MPRRIGLKFWRSTATTPNVTFSVICLADRDWSLKPISDAEGARTHTRLVRSLSKKLRDLGARHIFAPSPTAFNGIIVDPKELIPITSAPHLNIYRNVDKPADGSWLKQPGDAGIFSAGGCALIVVEYEDILLYAHAGRDSVLDRVRVESGERSCARYHQSVVDTLIERCDPLFMKPEKMRVWIYFTIRPQDFVHRFDDEKYGSYNRALASYLTAHHRGHEALIDKGGVLLDIPSIIAEQFAGYGVPATNIDRRYAYLPDCLPHTRNDNDERYLMVVVRQ